MVQEELVKIAHLSCGSEYSGIQKEIETAAEIVNARIFYPEISIEEVQQVQDDFGLHVASSDLGLVMARAKVLVEGNTNADAVLITTCFRCAEGAVVRNELRRYIYENSKLPVISYSFTERTTSGTLLTRLEALTTTARRRSLLAREHQEGLTAGIDSGSTTTKSVIMKDDKVIGRGWVPTTNVIQSANEAYNQALETAGVTRDEIQALGVTGYGRYLIKEEFNADLVQEEITVNSKGAVYLANSQHG
ncbi:Activator of 2-hydroxyglutaryl-CoA dehydratase (HSP70-class ATPase domain), partial [Candidatus Methanomarinus sp.]